MMWGVASVFGLTALLVAAGFTYQIVETCRDRGTYAMPGQLIAVDGLRPHIVCIVAGRPTVVLGSGLANRAADWDTVNPKWQVRHACAHMTAPALAGATMGRIRVIRCGLPTSYTRC